MGILSVDEIFEGRDTMESVAPDGHGVRTHVRQFRVKTDSAATRGTEILAHASIPVIFASHPDEGIFCTVRKRHAQQQSEGWCHWIVTIEYSTEATDPADNEDDPLDEPVKRSFRTEKVSKARTKDRDGNLIQNTAGLPYNPLPEVMRSISIYIFERNEESFTQAQVDALNDHVNSVAIGDREPGTVLCTIAAVDEEFRNGVAFVHVVYEFVYDQFGHQPDIPEEGYMARKQSDDTLFNITTPDGDDKGDPISEPWPLDSNGRSLSPSNIPDGKISTIWYVLEEADFNLLGLDFL